MQRGQNVLMDISLVLDNKKSCCQLDNRILEEISGSNLKPAGYDNFYCVVVVTGGVIGIFLFQS